MKNSIVVRCLLLATCLLYGSLQFFLLSNLVEIFRETGDASMLKNRSLGFNELERLYNDLNMINPRHILSNGFVVPMDYYSFLRTKLLVWGKDLPQKHLKIINASFGKYKSLREVNDKMISSLVSCRYDDCKLEQRTIPLDTLHLRIVSDGRHKNILICNRRKEIGVFTLYDC